MPSDSTIDTSRGKITAFVSWAHFHDSEDPRIAQRWEESVFRLAHQLRLFGIDVDIDLFHMHDNDVDWSNFGTQGINHADYVLIVASGAYKARWEGDGNPSRGAGAAREANVLKALFDSDRVAFRKRVKVVLLPGTGVDDAPTELQSAVQRFQIESIDLRGLSDLLRTLAGRPEWVKPAVGALPPLPPRQIDGLTGEMAPISSAAQQAGPQASGGNSQAVPSSMSTPAGEESAAPSLPVTEPSSPGRTERSLTLRPMRSSTPLARDSSRSAHQRAGRPPQAELAARGRAETLRYRGSPSPTGSPRPQRWGQAGWPRLKSPFGRRITVFAGVAAAAIATTLAVVALDSSYTGSTGAALYTSGPLVLGPAPGLRPGGRRIAGLSLVKPVLASTARVYVEAGELPAVAGVPASIPVALQASLGKPTNVSLTKLGAAPARSYQWSLTRSRLASGSTRGVQTLSLLIAVTESGEFIIACMGPAGDETIRECSMVRASARIDGTRTDYPGPDPRVAALLAETLGRRAAAIARAKGGLQSLRLRSRSKALSEIVRVDGQSVHALSAAHLPSHDRSPVAALVASLRIEASLAWKLAVVAHARNATLFDAWRARLDSAHIQRARLGLSAVGFEGLVLRPLMVPAAPRHPAVRSAASSTDSQLGGKTTSPPTTEGALSTESTPAATTPSKGEEPQVIVSKPE